MITGIAAATLIGYTFFSHVPASMLYNSSITFVLFFILSISISIADDADVDTIPAKTILQAEKDASSGTLKAASERNYPALKILGFVTPWNSGGVPTAKLAAEHGRLDSISPVTFNVRDGQVHGDEDFIRRLTDIRDVELHPRFNFEDTKWSNDIEQTAKNIVDACEEIGAKGAVLEVWGAASGQIAYIRLLGGFIKRDTSALKLTLVVPPLTKMMAGKMNAKSLGESYDAFVVMTYDYTIPNEKHGEPGPLSPVAWVKAVAEYWSKDAKLGSKVLLGLNFYGIDFAQRKGTKENEREQEGGTDKHITGGEVMKLLSAHKPELRWFKKDTVAEHVFEYSDAVSEGTFERLVFYPTSQSIQKRLDIAQETGCGGVAVWELGQGLLQFLNEF